MSGDQKSESWSPQIGMALQNLAQQVGKMGVEIPSQPSNHNPGAYSSNGNALVTMIQAFAKGLPRLEFSLRNDMFCDGKKKARSMRHN